LGDDDGERQIQPEQIFSIVQEAADYRRFRLSMSDRIDYDNHKYPLEVA